MKSSVQTRIFISLTPDEARAAVNDAVDMQLCVRSALYQIDGTPVATERTAIKRSLRPTGDEELYYFVGGGVGAEFDRLGLLLA